MSVSYSYPGVYIEEKDTGARPIQGVSTTTAAFIGVAPRADAFPLRPRDVNNFSQFRDMFGDRADQPNILANAVFGFFANGGSRCYVVNMGGEGSVRPALEALAAFDEIAMVAAPGRFDIDTTSALLGHCKDLRDRFAILDAAGPDRQDLDALVKVAQERAPARGAKADKEDGDAAAAGGAGLRAPMSERGYGAQYFPWIVTRDALNPSSRETVLMPPSGHVAGVYAGTDTRRGVFKAPANEILRGATGLAQGLTNAEQGKLNLAGVNCIRFFSNQGVVVWGARTLAPQGSNWTYVPVRRLALFIEQSIYRSTAWAVFEPNDRPLWKSLRRDVSDFLTVLWRRGALMGATAEQAFFVKCDEETNPPENVERGVVTVVIGIAPVKPAEFVVFEIGQVAGPASGQAGAGA